MNIWKRINKYIDIIVAIIVGYILLKLVDNYSYLFKGISSMLSIVTPFIYAFIIAYILNPVMKFFEKTLRLKRVYALILTYALIIGLMVITAVYFIPQLVQNMMDMASSVPQVMNEFQSWIDNLLKHNNVQFIKQYVDLNTNFITSKGTTIVLDLLNTAVSQLFSFTNTFIKWIFGFIISIYMLADKERFKKTSISFVKITLREKYADKFLTFIKTLNNMIGVYIGIKALDSLIIAIIASIGLTIIQSPYVVVLTVVVGLTNMIPYFGPFIGIVVGFALNIFVNPIRAFVVLIFLFLLQQFDGWYLDPKLIGGKVGLSPFLIILAVTLGGGIYGPVGMILAVPIMAVLKIYIDKALSKSNI